MKIYTTPELEITALETTDVITASGTLESVAELDSVETFSWETIKELLR